MMGKQINSNISNDHYTVEIYIIAIYVSFAKMLVALLYTGNKTIRRTSEKGLKTSILHVCFIIARFCLLATDNDGVKRKQRDTK